VSVLYARDLCWVQADQLFKGVILASRKQKRPDLASKFSASAKLHFMNELIY
jgi:hypothetical protein